MKEIIKNNEIVGYEIGNGIKVISDFYSTDCWFVSIPTLHIRHEYLCKKDCTKEEVARYIHLKINKVLLSVRELEREILNYTTSSSPIIVNEYQVYHFDDYPILYVGRNFVDKPIIGSFIEVDEDNDSLVRYLQCLVNEEAYQAFLNREITYLQALKKALNIFILIKDQKENVLLHDEIKFTELVDEYLPSENSFCPTLITQK